MVISLKKYQKQFSIFFKYVLNIVMDIARPNINFEEVPPPEGCTQKNKTLV